MSISSHKYKYQTQVRRDLLQIHVLKQGDTLFAIANTYGTTTEALIAANELDAPNQLVIGQAVVIPIVGQFYFVQPGDSLRSEEHTSELQSLGQLVCRLLLENK